MARAAIAAFVLALAATSSAFAVDVPAHDGYVTDVSGLLPATVQDELERKLSAYDKETSIEINVLIVPSIDDESLASYGDLVWERWRIGKKGEDNGVLLLVLPPPVKKVRIQTGYGVQGWLTDLDSKRIIEGMRPLNRMNRRAEAVVGAVDAIIAKLGDTPWAQRAKEAPQAAHAGGDMHPALAFILIILFIAFVIFFFIVVIKGMRSGSYGSGSSGGYDGGWGGSSGSSGGWSSGGGGGSSCGGGGDSGGGGADGGSD